MCVCMHACVRVSVQCVNLYSMCYDWNAHIDVCTCCVCSHTYTIVLICIVIITSLLLLFFFVNSCTYMHAHEHTHTHTTSIRSHICLLASFIASLPHCPYQYLSHTYFYKWTSQRHSNSVTALHIIRITCMACDIVWCSNSGHPCVMVCGGFIISAVCVL